MTLYAQVGEWSGRPELARFTPPFTYTPHRTDPLCLGVECYNVAAAINRGRGFADPFVMETGPTAWVAPVLPIVFAVGLWVTDGSRTLVALLYFALQVAVLSAVATYAYEEISR